MLGIAEILADARRRVARRFRQPGFGNRLKLRSGRAIGDRTKIAERRQHHRDGREIGTRDRCTRCNAIGNS